MWNYSQKQDWDARTSKKGQKKQGNTIGENFKLKKRIYRPHNWLKHYSV